MSDRTRRVEYVLLYDGADQALMDAAQAAVVIAETQESESLGRTGDDDTTLEDAIAERDRIETEVAERTEKLYLGVLDRHHWRWLIGQCPPRDNNKLDEIQGWNDEKFPDMLVASCIVDGEGADWLHKDEWESTLRAGVERLDGLHLAENELTEAFRTALTLCAGATDPKARRQRASLI